MDAGEAALLRARLIDDFTRRLDDALAEDEAPEGLADAALAATEAPSLYDLLAGLTALTQEVKLQGRAFRGLAETLEPLQGRQDEALRAHGEALALLRSRDGESRSEVERVRRDLLLVLCDLRDRLLRGLGDAERLLARARAAATPPGLVDRLWPARAAAQADLAAAADAVVQGVRLGLARIDESLAASGVTEVRCVGRPFDARVMSAADVVERDDATEGEVVAVLRRGYVRGGDTLLRVAEVQVARRPRGETT